MMLTKNLKKNIYITYVMEIVKRFSSLCKNRKTLLLKINETICGKISYLNKNNTAIISNLYIDPSYRNYGYATKLLQEAEKAAINDNIIENSQLNLTKIYNYNLCAWDPIDKPHLVSFYKKRGYIIDPTHCTHYYDDKDRIFELVKMSKEIVMVPPTQN